MELYVKYYIGQEVVYIDPTCFGLTPKKGRVKGFTFKQSGIERPQVTYQVVDADWGERDFFEGHLFASLSEFKEAMIQMIDLACKELEDKK